MSCRRRSGRISLLLLLHVSFGRSSVFICVYVIFTSLVLLSYQLFSSKCHYILVFLTVGGVRLGRNASISTGEEITGFGLRAADLKTITAHSVFFCYQTWLPGRPGQERKDVLMGAMLIQLGFKAAAGWYQVTGTWTGQTGTVQTTETTAAGQQQDEERWTVCVHHQCLVLKHVFTWCWTFNMKMPTPSSPCCCHCLHPLRCKFNVYTCVCSMKEIQDVLWQINYHEPWIVLLFIICHFYCFYVFVKHFATCLCAT